MLELWVYKDGDVNEILILIVTFWDTFLLTHVF